MNDKSQSMDEVLDTLLETLTAADMPFEVMNKAIDGIDYPLFKNLPKNLGELYQMGREFDAQPFLVDQYQRLSYREVLDQVACLAQALVNQFGIKKGDRVALAMRNSPEWCVAFMAITSIGAVAVAMNSWWKQTELLYAIDDTKQWTPVVGQ